MALGSGFRLRFLGRIVGLPGETVEVRHGRVFLNDRELIEPYLKGSLTLNMPSIKLPAGHFLILGDDVRFPHRLRRRGRPAATHPWTSDRCRPHEVAVLGGPMAMVTLTDVMKIYRMGTVEVPALKGCPLPSRLGVLLPSWVRQDAVNRPS